MVSLIMTSQISSVHQSAIFGVFFFAFFFVTNAFPRYQLRIPNGDRVPHPCDRSITWQGVGHQISAGSGPRNPFGEDFADEDHQWTPALCRLDSDGDGKTNGEELGDPDCVWQAESPPPIIWQSQLSHPGICEPITDPKCREKNWFLLKNELCIALLGTALPLPPTTPELTTLISTLGPIAGEAPRIREGFEVGPANHQEPPTTPVTIPPTPEVTTLISTLAPRSMTGLGVGPANNKQERYGFIKGTRNVAPADGPLFYLPPSGWPEDGKLERMQRNPIATTQRAFTLSKEQQASLFQLPASGSYATLADIYLSPITLRPIEIRYPEGKPPSREDLEQQLQFVTMPEVHVPEPTAFPIEEPASVYEPEEFTVPQQQPQFQPQAQPQPQLQPQPQFQSQLQPQQPQPQPKVQPLFSVAQPVGRPVQPMMIYHERPRTAPFFWVTNAAKGHHEHFYLIIVVIFSISFTVFKFLD